MNYRAHGTIGNKARTGMPKPPGSGRPRLLGEKLVSFTIRVDVAERVRWQIAALDRHTSAGALIREAMAEYLGDLE